MNDPKRPRIPLFNLSDDFVSLSKTEIAFANDHSLWFMKTFLWWTTHAAVSMLIAYTFQGRLRVMGAATEILLDIAAHSGI